MKFINKTVLTTLLSVSVLLMAPAQAEVNPFVNHTLSNVISDTGTESTKCGEGKCGENKVKAKSKCGEGKCGEGKSKTKKCGG